MQFTTLSHLGCWGCGATLSAKHQGTSAEVAEKLVTRGHRHTPQDNVRGLQKPACRPAWRSGTRCGDGSASEPRSDVDDLGDHQEGHEKGMDLKGQNAIGIGTSSIIYSSQSAVETFRPRAAAS